jgi:hypothetical protein
VAVAGREGEHLGGDVFSQTVGELVAVCVEDFGNTGDGGSRCGGTAGVGACDQDVNLTTAREGGSDGVEGGAFEAGVVVFCDN